MEGQCSSFPQVRCLRDHEIMVPMHVNTLDNLADLFTKVLDRPTFVKLRNMMLFPLPDSLVKSEEATLNT